jgi:pimeloyl-ACP methyl ester carboxylesterase
MKEKIYKKENIEIYYRINDILPERQTLVFVHGLSGSSSAWLEYENQFKKEYNIISLDLRGHGKSSRLNGRKHYEIENFAEDINELVESLDAKNFILICHSFGTLVALEFLARYPNKAASVIFLSPNFSVGKTKSERVIRSLINLLERASVFFPLLRKNGRHIDYSKYKNTGDWNLRRMFIDIRNTGLKTFLSCARNSYKFDREEFLNQIKIPSLLIHGKNDTIFSALNSKIMAEKIENAELILLDSANHIIVFNNFVEVSCAIKNFAEKTNNI